MNLADFPRPSGDNGLGIHFGLSHNPTEVSSYTSRMVELGLKWCLVPHQDERDLELVAESLGRVGILPVSRWICHIDQNIIDFTSFVRVLDDLGLAPYIQIFNEPSDLREWRDGVPKPLAFIGRWCDHAARVTAAGGLPGLQVLRVEELRAVLRELVERRATEVLARMWFCPHPYGANHPPDYPYDARNQYDRPGAVLEPDDTTVLQFLEFPPVFESEIGFVPPFIVGEGGWQYGNAEDGRYARIGDSNHASYHVTLFDWFRNGVLSNGEPLPDYLFAFCPWILYGPDADAWYSSSAGPRAQTIDAIRAIPRFTRARPLPNSATVLDHYLLLGRDSPSAKNDLLAAREYLARHEIAFGFSIEQATRARRVTIIGDQTGVSWEDEAALKRAGCRVERLLGDAAAIQTILADRSRRGVEFD